MLRIGVSACLLGRKVRYDGEHKRDDFLCDVLGAHVEYVPVCPEVELGLGTPRPTIRIERDTHGERLVMPKLGRDLTTEMTTYAERRAAALEKEDLSGYVLKKDSPSCGRERVKVHQADRVTRDGVGLFARALIARFPDLPVEEEGRLRDARLREAFIESVFAYHRVKELFRGRWKLADVVAFHTAHKLTLLAHQPLAYRALGRLVARGKTLERDTLRQQYTSGLMAAMRVPATRARHVNVLQHMAGYFKKSLDTASREELAGLIADYRRGLSPLIVPLTMIRHHARAQTVTYLLDQTYLAPDPHELLLRNHV